MPDMLKLLVITPLMLAAVAITSVLASTGRAGQSGSPGEAPVPDDEPGSASQTGSDDDVFPDLKYYQAPSLFICPVHLPRDYDPEVSYPLVIGLHGYASSPERFHTLYYAFDDPQYIYAAPQAPYPLPMGSNLGYSWFLNDMDGRLLEESRALTEQYVLDVIEQVSAEYKVSEIYLLGFSQGCSLAYIAGIKHPELIRGVICFACWFDPGWFDDGDVFSRAASLRMLVAHATDDPAVPFQQGVEAKEQLEQLGFEVRFLQFEGGHTLTAEVLKQVEAWIETAPGD